MSDTPSPKEFGKKYTPKPESKSSSGLFAKTTPIFAKRNPVSNIQSAAASQEPTDAPAGPPPPPPQDEPSLVPLPKKEPEAPVPAITQSEKPLEEKPSAVEFPIPPKPTPEPQLPEPPPLPPAAPAPLEPPALPSHLQEPTLKQQQHPPSHHIHKAIEPIAPIPVVTEKKYEPPRPHPPGPTHPPLPPELTVIFPSPAEKSVLATERDLANIVLVPAGTEIEGMIKTDRSLIIHGRVGGTGKSIGNLFTSGLIYISKSAKVEANIQCTRLEIFGSVDGEIIAREEVLLHHGGKLQGKVQTPNFKTEPGSFFKGTMEMTGADTNTPPAPPPPPPPLSPPKP